MRIMVIDRQTIFRQGVIGLIKDQPGIEIVGDDNPGPQVVEQVQAAEPDIVLMGTSFFKNGGGETMRQILNVYPDMTILVLSPYESEETLLAALRSGARGYLDVNVPPATLVKSLDALGRGEVVISRGLTRLLVAEYQRVIKLVPSVNAEIADMLTYREKEILRLLASESSNEEIANELFISGNTVRVHIHNILEKLGMKNRREAAKFARRL